MSKRLTLIFLFLALGFFLVIFRLFYWQVIKAKYLSSQARQQYKSERKISASRGNILASDESTLAARKQAWLVYASLPDLKENIEDLAQKLAPLFLKQDAGKDEILKETARLAELLAKKEVVWIALKHKADDEIKDNIEKLKLSGLGFTPEEDRFYPEASSSAHLLGFVGKNEEGEDTGYFGLEGYYNLVLSGKPGFLAREKDAKGAPILFKGLKEVDASEGIDLLTHIDKSLQFGVEKKLKEGIERYGAKAGSVVIMEPETGAILALAGFPSYDPYQYYSFSDEYFKNPVISDSFEPGSVFKVVVIAAALDAKAVTPETICDICQGPYKVDKYLIETWDKKYRPNSTVQDIIVHSDNVGMVFVANKLGKDKLYEYLDKFGFGRLTGIDLQGEASPSLRKKDDWNEVDLAVSGFGQGIALTPIQLVRAVAAIANGGKLMPPQVVDKVKKGSWSQDIKPKTERKVISSETAQQVTLMMMEAAKSGEAKWTNVSGFRVAGKTGTAQIPIAGHYDAEKTIASFVGFAPAEKPKFVMLVTLREPQTSPWASETAAPLWYNIAKDLFYFFAIQPDK